jgi:hypothetical protein
VKLLVRQCALGATLAAAASIACSGPTPVAPPPVVVNTAPTIESVTIAANRAEAGRDIQVTASVKDAETPLDQLTYTWSASPHTGTFSGSGPTVMWRPPTGQQTPDQYTITLTVSETFTSAGQPQQNTTALTTAPVPYNDSPAETTALAVQFIKDFGTFELSAEACVRNFSDNCRGKEREREQIARNRVDFRILSSAFDPRSPSFNGDLTTAVVEGPCVFEDIPQPPLPNAGRPQRVTGRCRLTLVYEQSRWFLCDSTFEGTGTTPLDLLRNRVPGSVVLGGRTGD